MEEGSDVRSWDELLPDALGLIFRNLPVQEILTVVPRVCKSWCRAVKGPYCWQEVDIEEWSLCCQQDQLERMLQMLITRSCGSLRKLCVSGLHTDMICNLIAENAGSLQTLRLRRSEMTDSMVEQIVGRLCMITFLDLSYCMKTSAHSLKMIGKNCKFLVGLCRNMHPLEIAGKPLEEDEAYAIASTMPRLKHLEMTYHVIGTKMVLEILSRCPELDFLDLRGCWDVKLDDKYLNEKFPKLTVLGPHVVDNDYYDRIDMDDASDLSDDSEYVVWDLGDGDDFYEDDTESFDEMWDDERRLEELELRFYEGMENAGVYGLHLHNS